MAFPFLSEEWILAAREIRARHEDQTPNIPASVRANLNINEVPFAGGSLQAHLDTSSGRMEMDLGHLDPADATLTMDYATARSFVVDQDPTAIMQAVMAGKVKIQGDLSKLMAMASLGQSAGAGGASEGALLAGKIAQEIKDITEGTTVESTAPAPTPAPAPEAATTPSPPEASAPTAVSAPSEVSDPPADPPADPPPAGPPSSSTD